MSDPPHLVAAVDVGGTFTDAVVWTDDGPRLAKVPTTPADQGAGLAAALATALSPTGAPTPDSPAAPPARGAPDPGPAGTAVALLAHGTTTATNAVLERRLDRAVLLVTEGFADVLTIGRQDRPSLYDLTVVRPAPAIPRHMVLGVPERITVGGEVLRPLTDDAIADVVTATAALDPDAVAICLLFSWANPDHELRLAEALRRGLPGVHLTTSVDLVGAIREYERASTCALNAAVGRTMSRYLGGLEDRLPAADITVMTSGGGTATVSRMVAEPVHTLLSGPAGGVVAAARAATDAGFDDAIAFDMGGTSTDVCLIRRGTPQVSIEGTIDGLPIGTPTIAIHTVGAGGGSVASLDAGGALQVGPRSAGAEPGPACYGRGGTLPTVTDAHALLGHLHDLAGGQVPLDLDAARAAFDAADGVTAQGVLDVVRASMARALRRVSTEVGVDPAGLALVAYGGAGPLHATALARMLGCRATVLPPAPGVLSAVGLLMAPQRREWSRTVMTDPEGLADALRDLVRTAADGRSLHGFTTFADMRYAGQAHELRIETDPASAQLARQGHRPDLDPVEHFHVVHERTYGYALREDPVQVVTVRVVQRGQALLEGPLEGWDLGPTTPTTTTTADMGRGPETIARIARGSLSPGDVVRGPAIVTQPDATTLLLQGDVGTVRPDRTLVVPTPGVAVPA